jgi:hypothetical protein
MAISATLCHLFCFENKPANIKVGWSTLTVILVTFVANLIYASIHPFKRLVRNFKLLNLRQQRLRKLEEAIKAKERELRR